ncbi:ABC transporter permease subunit [Ilumatobacter sp.]|uniref:ABC transporter permease subunit n=1 Tax=Ilumatobacter sp. TaxID=1967498 RepID=UPI003B5233BA
MPNTTSRSQGRRALVQLLVGVVVAVLGSLSTGVVASAQESDEPTDTSVTGDPTAEGTDAEPSSSETIGGTLRTRDEDGEDVFLEGVTFIVTDSESGDEVGTGQSDVEGAWRVDLPGPGTYSVQIVEESLPEGNSLRNPDNNPLNDIAVQTNTDKNVLFPLGERQDSSSSTIRVVQLLVDGIKLGMIIAICAIGLSLIFGTTGLVNFAHGEMVTIGAMVAFVVHVTFDGRILGIPGTNSLVFGAIAAIVICGFLGFLFNAGVWRPMRSSGASLISALVVSIGFSILLRYVVLYQYGGRNGFYRDFRIGDQIDFTYFTILRKDLFIVVITLLVLIAVGLALQKTRAGKAMRAVADNRDLAESSGIDVERVIRLVWIVGSALAGLGGVLFGLTENINWEMGFRLLLLMFAGVTLGGLGTAYGALFGSLIAGIFIQMSTLVFPGDIKNVGALIALILILLIRPQGLLGRAERIG